MKTYRYRLNAFLFATLLICSVLLVTPILAGGSKSGIRGNQDTRDVLDADSLDAFVKDFLEPRMETAHIPGLVFVLVKDGQVVLARGYGYADLEKHQPMTAQAVVRAGSVSKPVMATAVMQLVERGLLDLDAPVSDYISDLGLADRFGEASTIRQLLTLQGGYPDAVVETHAPSIETWVPLGEYLNGNLPERVNPPGKVISYTSWEMALLGYALEKASGMPYEQVVEQNLLAPLGMRSSTYLQPQPAAIRQELATGYGYFDGEFRVIPHDYVKLSPGIGLVTSGEDIGRFMLMLLQGGQFEGARLLEESTVAGILSRQASAHPLSRGRTFGFSEITLAGRPVLYHDGNGIGFASRMILAPEQGLGIFMSVNHRALGFDASATPARLAMQDLGNAVLEQYLPEPAETGVEIDASFYTEHDLARYQGHYQLAGTPQMDFFKVGALLDYVDVRADQTGELQIGSRRYQSVEPGVFRDTDDGGVVVFIENDDGQPAYLTFGGTNSYKKVSWQQSFNFNVLLVGGMLLVFLVYAIAWPFARKGGWLVWALSLVNLAFLLGFGYLMLKVDLLLFFKLIPWYVKLLFGLPWISLVLTLASVVLLVRRWRDRGFSVWVKGLATLATLTSIALLWFVFNWNLILK